MAGNSKISAVFGTDTRELERGIKRAQATLNELKGTTTGLSASMQRLGKAVSLNTFVQLGQIAAAAIGKFSTQVQYAIGQATDLGEELSKSSQIFGENAGEIEKFANSAASLGFTKVAALQAAGSFGNMFTAMKLSNAQSADMSLTFTKLAADMASFNNTSVDDAVTALGAALRGESEPIRRFGVLLDDATLRAKAFELGMTKSAKDAMTPAIKAQAAYAAILDQTAKAQGDFARTSGGLANMGRVMQAEVGNLATELGKVFVPVLESFGAAITNILQAVTPIVAQAANTLVDGWNAVAPAVITTFWDAAELFGRAIDVAAGVWNVVFESFRSIISGFAALLPDFGSSIDYWAVAVEVFQRAISLLEGVAAGFSATWRYVAGTLAAAVKNALDAAAWLTEKLGQDSSSLREMAANADKLSGELYLAADKFAADAGAKMTNAFSSNFEATDLGKKATAILTEGMEGGFESFLETAREGWAAMPKATKAAAVQVAGQMGEVAAGAAAAVAKEVSLFDGTTGASNYVAGLMNKAAAALAKGVSQSGEKTGVSDHVAGLIDKTGSSVEKRQLSAAERTAEGIEKIVDKVGLEAVSIA